MLAPIGPYGHFTDRCLASGNCQRLRTALGTGADDEFLWRRNQEGIEHAVALDEARRSHLGLVGAGPTGLPTSSRVLTLIAGTKVDEGPAKAKLSTALLF